MSFSKIFGILGMSLEPERQFLFFCWNYLKIVSLRHEKFGIFLSIWLTVAYNYWVILKWNGKLFTKIFFCTNQRFYQMKCNLFDVSSNAVIYLLETKMTSTLSAQINSVTKMRFSSWSQFETCKRWKCS